MATKQLKDVDEFYASIKERESRPPRYEISDAAVGMTGRVP